MLNRKATGKVRGGQINTDAVEMSKRELIIRNYSEPGHITVHFSEGECESKGREWPHPL